MEQRRWLFKITFAVLVWISVHPMNGEAEERGFQKNSSNLMGQARPNKDQTSSGSYQMRELTNRYPEGSASPAGEYHPTRIIERMNTSSDPNVYQINKETRRSSTTLNNAGYTTQGERNAYYYDSFNANRTGPTSPTYVDTYREAAIEGNSAPAYFDKGMNNLNREYNAVSDYDFNRTAATTVTSSATLTDVQLISMLTPQGRSMYLSLDSEAKALAIQLASQDSYRDKNLAVKEAHRRMNERRGIMDR